MIDLNRIYGLSINLDDLKETRTKISFKQYDYQTSYIALNFYKDGVILPDISENYIIAVYKDEAGDLFVDKNGSPIKTYAFNYQETGLIILPISTDVLTKTGKILCELIIINGEGKKITSPRFSFTIHPSLLDFKVEQEEYLKTVCGTFRAGNKLCGSGDARSIDVEKYITYEKTVWINGETVVDEEKLNKIEEGIYNATEAVNILNAEYEEYTTATEEKLEKIEESISSVTENIDNLSANSIEYTTAADSSITTIKEALDKLLYAPLTINLSSNVSTTLEKGYVVNNVIFNWSYNKNITQQKFNNEIIELSLRRYEYATPFNANKSFKLEASDEKNSFNKSINFNFLNKRYWGASSITTYNSEFILSLTGELVESKSKTFTVNCLENQYIYYCIPSRLGNCSFKVGGFEGGFNKVETVQFTNSSGFTENYDIWKSTNSNLGNTTVVVS